MTKTLPALLLLLALIGPAGAEPPATAPTAPAEVELAPDARDDDLASFDQVWETVRDKNPDPAFGGVDWDAARETYRPKVADAASTDEARGHIQALLDLLGQSHMGVIPGEAYDAFADDGGDEGGVDKDGQPGFRVRLVGRDVLVVSVEEGGPGDRAGVRPGWQVTAVGDKPVAEIVDALAEAVTAQGRGKLETYASFAVQKRLDGPVGTSKSVAFVDGEGQARTLNVELEKPDGNVTQLGALPPMRVNFESRRIEENGLSVGYVAFNAFLDPPNVMRGYNAAMADFRGDGDAAKVDGVVIDLRGNIGGIITMTSNMAGQLVAEPGQKLGTLRARDLELKLVVFPQARVYDGPVAVLTDACSVSAAELLAGGLQALDRAEIIGQPTAGEALPALFTRLPNGDGFIFVFADYEAEGGVRLEGDGVQPDLLVDYDRDALLSGRDPMLEAAMKYIRGAGGR